METTYSKEQRKTYRGRGKLIDGIKAPADQHKTNQNRDLKPPQAAWFQVPGILQEQMPNIHHYPSISKQ